MLHVYRAGRRLALRLDLTGLPPPDDYLLFLEILDERLVAFAGAAAGG